MTWFKMEDIANVNSDLPTPQDPSVLKAMINRGMLIYVLIVSLILTVAPALLISIGIATFHALGIPVCGVIGQLEVLEDPIRCGTKIAWEFYVGVSVLGVAFLFAFMNIGVLRAKGQVGMKRLKRLREKLAAFRATGSDENA